MEARLITNTFVYKTERFLKKNSSTILSIVGATGVVVTAIATSRATLKVSTLLKKEEQEKGGKLTKKEIVFTAAPSCIPPVVIGVSTIACILGANVLSRRQQASLTSAYTLLNSSYKEYKKKLIELYGKDKDAEIRAAIARDKYLAEPPIITAYGFGPLTDLTEVADIGELVLFYDDFSGRYFESTISEVQAAEYHLNRNFSLRGCAAVNEFYEFLGIPQIESGDVLGWSMSCGYNWVDFNHEKTVLDDGLECYLIGYEFEPDDEF